MKRTCTLLVLLVSISLLLPTSSIASRGIKSGYLSPSGKTVTGDNWLFVVGINEYTKWPRLETAVSDAKSLKSVLLDRYCFDGKKVVELYNGEATRTNIIGKLRYLANNVKKNDSLVIFYAGHGHIDSITKEGSWIPVDSDTKNSAAWVSNHDIKKYLSINAIKAKHILLISDSCFAGDFFRGKRGTLPEVTSAVVKKAFKLASRQAITSGGLEPVSDAGFGNNSVFSHFLIKTLKENTDPFLIPSALFPDVKAGVAENAEQFPQFGSLQGTGGQQGGELVFFLKQDTRLKDLSKATAAKSKELIRLQKLEQEERLAKKREQAEIAKRNKELAAMDAKIAAMKKRLGTSSERSDDSLKTMLAMVRKKKEQKKKLMALKHQKAKEAAKRQAEIDKIKREARAKELVALKEDIRDYTEIVTSEFGKDMAESAWQSLVSKYPRRAKGVAKGDVKGLIGPGWLQIKTTPKETEIRFVNSGKALKKDQPLKPGRYNLEVSAEGHFTRKATVTIRGGETTSTTISLERGLQNSIGMKFVYIKPGNFNMGSPSTEAYRGRSETQHRVTLSKGYYMQTTEVTQGQWRSVMGNSPSYFKNCGDNCPVEQVSWNDAKDFIRKLNAKEGTNKYRLPTEAEWEYACRAGTTEPFNTGKCLSTDQANYNGNYPYSGCRKGKYKEKTIPVGSFQPNVWGLYDMHGNVREWCEDWSGEYPNGSQTDPGGPSSGKYRVLRGGSWFNYAWYCRSANRFGDPPDNRVIYIGFRLAVSAGLSQD